MGNEITGEEWNAAMRCGHGQPLQEHCDKCPIPIGFSTHMPMPGKMYYQCTKCLALVDTVSDALKHTCRVDDDRRHANSAGQQKGGGHYWRQGGEEFQIYDAWWRWNLDPFQATIIKHVCRPKGTTQEEKLLDIDKALHYLKKYRELVAKGIYTPTPTNTE